MSINSLLKIFYFFKTIKAKSCFKLSWFTFSLKGLKHIGSYQSLYKHCEFNLLFLKKAEKNQNVKKEKNV